MACIRRMKSTTWRITTRASGRWRTFLSSTARRNCRARIVSVAVEHSVGGRQRNDEAADSDECASKQHGMTGLLMKNDPGDGLGNKKEKHDIHADQSAEIPGWHIDRPTIAEQNQGSGDEEQDARNRSRRTQPESDERIAAGFEQRGQKQ